MKDRQLRALEVADWNRTMVRQVRGARSYDRVELSRLLMVSHPVEYRHGFRAYLWIATSPRPHGRPRRADRDEFHLYVPGYPVGVVQVPHSAWGGGADPPSIAREVAIRLEEAAGVAPEAVRRVETRLRHNLPVKVIEVDRTSPRWWEKDYAEVQSP